MFQIQQFLKNTYMKNTTEAYPLRAIDFEWVHFLDTNLWIWWLGNILNSAQEGANIWIKLDGTPMRVGVGIYNKDILPFPWIFVVAFDTKDARDLQVEASNQLENVDTWEYTLPDITTFFEIEKDGKELYCYVVDRMDMWKHKKDMLVWEMDDISIDGVIVYPAGIQDKIVRTWEELLIQKTNVAVEGIMQPKS